MDDFQIKTFPNLMRGKRILYVHGFGSSAQTGTVRLLRQLMPQAEVLAFDIPLHPQEAMALLRERCAALQPHLIIGTSMGGMYTEMLYGFDRILVNPAFEMADTMREHGMTGMQRWHNPREDGQEEFLVNKQLVKEFREITEACFSHAAEEDQSRVWGLFGDKDDRVHTFDLFRQHYQNAVRFHGGHRLCDSSLLHGVVPVVRWIDDHQDGRERPIVFVGIETLVDKWENPASSMLKSLEHLAENYQVMVVADSPTADALYIKKVRARVEEYVGTLAHNRLLFCNQRHLLLGDYLVATKKEPRFMGTNIVFGSEEMKTWDDIVVFFDRLGGQ